MSDKTSISVSAPYFVSRSYIEIVPSATPYHVIFCPKIGIGKPLFQRLVTEIRNICISFRVFAYLNNVCAYMVICNSFPSCSCEMSVYKDLRGDTLSALWQFKHERNF